MMQKSAFTIPVADQTIQRKSNKDFMILSALGILFVVDVHLGKPLSILTQVFPYDSFFMPMFVFISGYFFKAKHCENWRSLFHYIVGKIRKMLLPYLGWILFYGVAICILQQVEILEKSKIDLIDVVHNIITAGTSFGFNDPAWFVPLLFCVIVAYSGLYMCFKKHWNSWIVMGMLALLGALAVTVSQTEWRTNNTYMLLKVPFFLQFFHLGVFFRQKLEVLFDKAHPVTVCLSACAVNLYLISIYGSDIAFPMCASMSGFFTNNPLLPLITSITGIAFWLKISKLLVPSLGHSPLVNFISDHTAFIMTHHVGVKHLFTGLLIFAGNHGISGFEGIDLQAFRTDPWYVYTDTPWITFACFLFTVSFLVITCKAVLHLKNQIQKKKP